VTSVLLAAATVRLRSTHRVALAASGFDVHEVARPEEIGNRLARASIDVMVIDVTRDYGGSALLQQLSRDADLITAASERVVAAVRRIAAGSSERTASAPVAIGEVSDER
jgi:DNA-binding NtrC family response regulator